jgi:serine/threonine-protein kinase
MTPKESLACFVNAIERSRILTPGQMQELAEHLRGHQPDVRALGRALLDWGWLTPYQVNQASLGREHRLSVDHYVLLARVGRGSTGEVFKARHRLMGRLAAVKLIHAERLASPNAVARFLREAEAAARLNHPNVVHAYDAGQAGGTYYLAMEYVEGIDLGRLVEAQGPLDAVRACDCIRQAALGLAHALGRGVVHRDVKPSNLLLEEGSSVVKVVDLGLARLEWIEGNAGPLTLAGNAVGTADYLAPEQVMGCPADARSDLYGLGCTLYYLLTGRPPFPGGSVAQKLLHHLHDEPEPVERLRPGLPSGLAELQRRLMAKKPHDRFQGPAEAANALADLLSGLRDDSVLS